MDTRRRLSKCHSNPSPFLPLFFSLWLRRKFLHKPRKPAHCSIRMCNLLSLCRPDGDSGLATRLNEAQKLLLHCGAFLQLQTALWQLCAGDFRVCRFAFIPGSPTRAQLPPHSFGDV